MGIDSDLRKTMVQMEEDEEKRRREKARVATPIPPAPFDPASSVAVRLAAEEAGILENRLADIERRLIALEGALGVKAKDLLK